MAPLAQLQEGFFRAIASGELESFSPAVRAGRVSAAARLATYARGVQANWCEALAGTYPVVARLVGEGFFAQAAREHARAFPSKSGDLHGYGSRFAEFLESYAPAASLPYLPDVARLEWAWHRAFHAADDGPLDLEALGRVAADDQPAIRFRLHPSVHLLRSEHPIAAVWEANQEGRDGTLVGDWQAEWVLVHRQDLEVVVQRLASPEWELLAAIRDGADLEGAAGLLGTEASALLAPLLSRMAASGVFAGFEA